jgi:hypothetical protein
MVVSFVSEGGEGGARRDRQGGTRFDDYRQVIEDVRMRSTCTRRVRGADVANMRQNLSSPS